MSHDLCLVHLSVSVTAVPNSPDAFEGAATCLPLSRLVLLSLPLSLLS